MLINLTDKYGCGRRGRRREEEKEDLKDMSNDQTCVKRMSLQILNVVLINVHKHMLTFCQTKVYLGRTVIQIGVILINFNYIISA
jgi:hypothetical protein